MTNPPLTVKPPPDAYQPWLLDVIPDKPLNKNGEARTRYGRIVERIAIELLGLIDIPNSGSHDAVFDAWGHGTYCEIKSVRTKNKCPIYEWRREKDEQAGVPLVYIFVTHSCKGAKTLREAWERMCDTIDNIYIVPASVVNDMVEGETLRQIVEEEKGGRMGYRRKGYCEGYRNISWSKIAAIGCGKAAQVEGEIYDLKLSAQVHVHRSLTHWLTTPNDA